MRDMIYIALLFAVFAFLATRFPGDLPAVVADTDLRRPFASFVTLSPEVNASCLDAVRTPWQVRRDARSRPAIGRLDSGIALLEEAMPKAVASLSEVAMPAAASLPPAGPAAYSLLPFTMGRDVETFAVRAQPRDRVAHARTPATPPAAFSRDDMLSAENSMLLKEMMQ